MSFLYDFIPIILFFVAFKVAGIYVATVVGIVITAIQVLLTLIFKRKFDKQQLITLIVFVIFGGMTLYFHNPIFVKWKPTIVYWIFGIVLLGSHFIGKKTIMQRMLEGVLSNAHKPALTTGSEIVNSADEPQSKFPKGMVLSNPTIWKKINAAWAVFFLLMGGINLFVAYHFSTDAWVNFKLYGTLGLVLLFSLVQSVYLAKHLSEVK